MFYFEMAAPHKLMNNSSTQVIPVFSMVGKSSLLVLIHFDINGEISEPFNNP